jgi:hypothetical protein
MSALVHTDMGDIPFSQFAVFSQKANSDYIGIVLSGSSRVEVEVSYSDLMEALKQSAPVIQATPGYYALEQRNDARGRFDVTKSAIIAWRIWDGAAHPITLDPDAHPVAVLAPDERVEDFIGIQHDSLAEFIDWMRDDTRWDNVVLPD